jgi:hypothetical protein
MSAAGTSASVFTLGSGADGNGCERESAALSFVETLTAADAIVTVFAVPSICGKGHRSKIVANNIVITSV